MRVLHNKFSYATCALNNFGAGNKGFADITVATQTLGRPARAAHKTQRLGFDARWVSRVTVNQISRRIFMDSFAHTNQRLAIQAVAGIQENDKVARFEFVGCRNDSHTAKRPAALQMFYRIWHSTINKPLNIFRPRNDK